MRFPFKRMDAFCNGLAIVCSDDDKKGMIDKSGKVVIPPIYDSIYFHKDYKYIIVENGEFCELNYNDKCIRPHIQGKYGVLDLEGHILIPFKYSDIMWCSEDCLRVGYNEKYGVINLQNEIVLPLEYDWLNYPCENGWMLAGRNGKEGIITLKGEIIFPFIYDWITIGGSKEPDRILAKCKGEWFFMNSKGERILTLNEVEGKKVVDCKDFHDGRVVVTVEDKDGKNSNQKKTGMIDTTGKWIIPPVYDYIEYAGGKFALVKLGATHNDSSYFISGKCGVVDLDNNIVLPIEYESADCLISKNCDCWCIKNTAGLCGVINLRTGEVIPCKYDNLSSYCKGYLSAKMNGRYGLISLQDEIILPFIFNEIGYSSATELDWIPVKLAGKWFYMDRYGQRQFVGKMVISKAWPFNKKGMAEVEVKDEYSSGCGIIDRTGKFIIPPVYFYFGFCERDGLFMVNVGGFCCGGDYCDEDEATYEEEVYGLVDVNNRLLIPIMYDEMIYLKDDCWIVEKDGKCGVVNQRNEIVLPMEYDCLSDYHENPEWLTAKKDGKWEVITLTGEVVPPDVYESVFPPVKREPDWRVVRCEGKEFYVERDGRKVFGEEVNFIHADPFVDGTAVVEAKYEVPYLKHGLIDTTGKYIIPPIYDDLYSIGRNEYKAKGFIIVNIGCQRSGYEIYEDMWQYYSCGNDEHGKWGVIDLNNRILISIKYTSLYHAKDDCFTAELDGKWGVVNLREEIVLPFEYEYLSYWDDWGLKAKKDGKYGVITLEGKIVLPFIYDFINLPDSYVNQNMDLIPVGYEGEAFYIDRTGKRVLL